MDANGHVNINPSIQFFVNSQSKSYILSLTVCVWDIQNNALWDTHYHALFNDTMLGSDSLQYQLSVHLIQKLIIIVCTPERNNWSNLTSWTISIAAHISGRNECQNASIKLFPW